MHKRTTMRTITRAKVRELRGTSLAAGMAIAASALLLAPAWGQPGGFGGPGGARFGGGSGLGDSEFGECLHTRRTERLADFLELTDEQIASWEAQQEATRAQLEPLREESQANRQELRDLLEGDAPDATVVGQTVLDGKALREQTQAIHEAAKADFEALLTAEQLERYETFQELRPDRRRGGRRGPGRRGGRGGRFGDGEGRFGGAALD